MGNCMVGESPYRVLRYSLPGALLPSDNDFREFFHICQTETHTLSSLLPITPTQCFFVVVSGEVNITLSTKNKPRPEIVSTVLPGDLILFFGVNVDAPIVNGCMELDNTKVGLQFRSSDGLAQVIGCDYMAVRQFLDQRPYLNAMRSLMDMKLDSFIASTGFLSLTKNQVYALAPLIRIRAAKAGQVLRYAMKDPTSEYVSLAPFENSTLIVPPITSNSVGMLLSGSGIAVPSGSDLSDIIHERRNAIGGTLNANNSASPVNSITNRGSSNKSSSDTKRSLLGHIREYMGGRARGYVLQESSKETGMAEIFTPELKAELVKIYPGAIFGLEQFMVKNSSMALDSIVSLESTLVGYLEFDALRGLFQIDRRLKRVLQRNFLKGVLDSVRNVVPMLTEMEDKGYVVLSTLINLKCFNKDDQVFSKGSPSDYSYIVMRGLIKEAGEKQQNGSGSSGSSKAPLPQLTEGEDVRYLGYGNLFGEVSLVTESPYFTTTHAVEPTLLVSINKRALDRIFNNDKAKLAEMRIRLVGADVELQHILNHPMGNRLLCEFLKRELSAENIQFLNAVVKFEDIVERLRRELQSIQVLHSRHLDETRALRQSFNNENNAAAAAANAAEKQRSGVAAAPRGHEAVHTQEVDDDAENSFSASQSHSQSQSIAAERAYITTSSSAASDRERDRERSSSSRRATGASSGALLGESSGDLSSLRRSFSLDALGLGASGVGLTVALGAPCVIDFVESLDRAMHSPGGAAQLARRGSRGGAMLGALHGENSETERDSPRHEKTPAESNIAANESQGAEGKRKGAPGAVSLTSNTSGCGSAATAAESDPQAGAATAPSLSLSGAIAGAAPVAEQRRPSPSPSLSLSGAPSRHGSHGNLDRERDRDRDRERDPHGLSIFDGMHDFSQPSISLPLAAHSNTLTLTTAPHNALSVSPSLSSQDYAALLLSQFHKLHKNILELKEVSRKIVDKYVREGAECEINVSAANRMSLLETHREWLALDVHESLRRLLVCSPEYRHANAHNHKHAHHHTQTLPPHNTLSQQHRDSSHSSVALHTKTTTEGNNTQNDVQPFTSARAAWAGPEDGAPLDHTRLFSRAKQDVFQLLQRDAFVRFTQTTEFASFIAAIRPFDHHAQHTAAGSVRSMNHTTLSPNMNNTLGATQDTQDTLLYAPGAPDALLSAAAAQQQSETSFGSVSSVATNTHNAHSQQQGLRRVSFHRAPHSRSSLVGAPGAGAAPGVSFSPSPAPGAPSLSPSAPQSVSANAALSAASQDAAPHSAVSHSPSPAHSLRAIHTPTLPTVLDTSPQSRLAQRKTLSVSLSVSPSATAAAAPPNRDDETVPFDALSPSQRERERDGDAVVSVRKPAQFARGFSNNAVAPIG